MSPSPTITSVGTRIRGVAGREADRRARWMAASARRSAPVESAKERNAAAVLSSIADGLSASRASAMRGARLANAGPPRRPPTPPRTAERARASRPTSAYVVMAPIEYPHTSTCSMPRWSRSASASRTIASSA